MLALLGDIPFYLLVLVIFRDIVIIVGYFVLKMVMDVSVPIRPIYWSKINTFLQIALVVVVLFDRSGWLSLPFLLDALIIGVVITSVVSGLLYVWNWGFKRDLFNQADS